MVRSTSAVTQRHETIRELLLEHGTVRSEELAKDLDVSVMTIHRDLDTLAAQGWLRRIRGGGTVQRSALFELNVRARMKENSEQKEIIAGAALGLISKGDAIILDDSTTALALAEVINRAGPITLVTNFRKIVDAVVGESDIDIISLGGRYHASYDSFLGEMTVESLRSLQADIAFVSASAVNGTACFHQVHESIAVKRAIMGAATKTVLLLDHSKFEKRALHRFSALEDFDTIVVDDMVSDENLRLLRDSNDNVIVANSGTHPR